VKPLRFAAWNWTRPGFNDRPRNWWKFYWLAACPVTVCALLQQDDDVFAAGGHPAAGGLVEKEAAGLFAGRRAIRWDPVSWPRELGLGLHDGVHVENHHVGASGPESGRSAGWNAVWSPAAPSGFTSANCCGRTR
jgi:hypothetical protein